MSKRLKTAREMDYCDCSNCSTCKRSPSKREEKIILEENQRESDHCVDDLFKDGGEYTNFWNNVDLYMEKIMRGSGIDVPLVGCSTYFLNKSTTKWVSVGLSPGNDFDVRIKIAGAKKQCITLSAYEWKRFIEEKNVLQRYVTKEVNLFPPLRMANLRISCECYDGVTKVLKIEKDSDILYLSYEGLKELWRLAGLVNVRTEYLTSLQYEKHYKEILIYLSTREGDLFQEVEQMMNGVVSEYGAITMELLTIGLEKIVADVQLMKKANA